MLVACPDSALEELNIKLPSLEMQHTKVIISRDILSLYIRASFSIRKGYFKFYLNRSATSPAKTSTAFGKILS